jgi:glutamine phosphoribosylpyrophosphate amidotransferase
MCGVFGFVAKDKGPLNLKILQRVATVTQRRGPHAWGMAWINSSGRIFMYKQTGRIRDSLGLLTMARDAVLLIGHTRYATQGDPANNLNNHPHPCDGGWIVHNGMIPNYREIASRYDLHLTTQCDSEVLCRLIERLDGNLVSRCGNGQHRRFTEPGDAGPVEAGSADCRAARKPLAPGRDRPRVLPGFAGGRAAGRSERDCRPAGP